MTGSNGPTCAELIEFLADYLDDRLPAGQRRSFDLHLEACPECLDYLATYRATIEFVGEWGRPPSTASEPVPEELLAAVLAARREG